MPRLSKKTWIALLALCLIVLCGYLLWTRASALVVIRWFVQETGIPVEVKSARWEVSLQKLLRGRIDHLHVDLFYKPLKVHATIDTPVEYVRHREQWAIRLKPLLQINELPNASGTFDLVLDRKLGATVRFDMGQTRKLELHAGTALIKAEKWNVSGLISWNPMAERKWLGDLKGTASGVSVSREDVSASIGEVKLDGDLFWPVAPPLPFQAKTNLRLQEINVFAGKTFIQEASIPLQAAFDFDGSRFEHVDISVDKPFHARIKGSLHDSNAQTQFEVRAPLEQLIDERLSVWLEPVAPVLSRAKASGELRLKGSIATRPKTQPSVLGDLHLDVRALHLPDKNLKATGFTLKAPLRYPERPGWGSAQAREIDFHSVKLKNVGMDVQLASDSIALTTTPESGKDRPIRQHVWGGTMDISDLYARIPLRSDVASEFTLSVTGGPFAIPAIQSDLCVLPDSPIQGNVTFTYPKVVRSKNGLRLIGDTNLDIFNGTAHVGDIQLLLHERLPQLSFSFDWNDLDLKAIGAWTKIGDMRGSFEGALKNTTLALSASGPIPLSYDFTVRGKPRGGKDIRLYGRAVDNVLELLGSRKSDLPFYASAILTLGSAFYNLFPVHVEYMGFHARSDGQWTELSTFDPDPDPTGRRRSTCDPKKHYLLCSGAVKIPINTHGVFPVLMSTFDFHVWLNGRLEHVKGLMANDKKSSTQKPQCTPPWQ